MAWSERGDIAETGNIAMPEIERNDVDDLAAALWRAEATDAGTPQSVADGRTPESFAEQSDGLKKRWRKFARVALDLQTFDAPQPIGMQWRMADGQLIALFGPDMEGGLQHYGVPGRRLFDEDQMLLLEREARHWRKNHDHVVAESRKKRAYPAEMTDNLRKILGLMMWNTGSMAHLLRDDGMDIPRKAEDEQAYVMHWLVNLALQHPDDWHKKANDRLRLISEREARQ